jgi:entericidin B
MLLELGSLACQMQQSQSSFSRKEGKMVRVKTIVTALYLTCSLAGSMACNTVHGMGQDIERGGEKTQGASDAVKRRM